MDNKFLCKDCIHNTTNKQYFNIDVKVIRIFCEKHRKWVLINTDIECKDYKDDRKV